MHGVDRTFYVYALITSSIQSKSEENKNQIIIIGYGKLS